jgi:hypothetical protein
LLGSSALVLVATLCWLDAVAGGQMAALPSEQISAARNSPISGACAESSSWARIEDAGPRTWLRRPQISRDPAPGRAIVVGFVGGFVNPNDARHPEVQFASYLRRRYPLSAYVEVFANHDGRRALLRILHLLDTDGDGVLTDREKEQAKIILYGHSRGASETIRLARELAQQQIPVRLTIQVDSIHKPGQDDSEIPANVRQAINFYQSQSLLHGRSRIRAEDPARTDIIGNIHMWYRSRRISCSNFRPIARLFNRSHLEIENDPLVWQQIASLIDAEFPATGAQGEYSLIEP